EGVLRRDSGRITGPAAQRVVVGEPVIAGEEVDVVAEVVTLLVADVPLAARRLLLGPRRTRRGGGQDGGQGQGAAGEAEREAHRGLLLGCAGRRWLEELTAKMAHNTGFRRRSQAGYDDRRCWTCAGSSSERSRSWAPPSAVAGRGTCGSCSGRSPT